MPTRRKRPGTLRAAPRSRPAGTARPAIISLTTSRTTPRCISSSWRRARARSAPAARAGRTGELAETPRVFRPGPSGLWSPRHLHARLAPVTCTARGGRRPGVPPSRAESRRSRRSPCHPWHCPPWRGTWTVRCPGDRRRRPGTQPSRPCRRSAPNSNPGIEPKARPSADLVAGPAPNPKIKRTDFADSVSGQGPAIKPPISPSRRVRVRIHLTRAA